ncbi:hypothetical protein BGW38_005614, partial [Lunasporangiospora selenospora]
FLGDALLVVFQADPVSEHHLDGSSPPNSDLSRSDFPTADELSGSSRRNGVLVRKAVDCGLELLARLSNFSINLSQEAYPCRVSTPSPTPDDPQQINRQDSDDNSTLAGSQIGTGYSKSQWNGSSGSYGSYNNNNNGTVSSATSHYFLSVPNRSTTNIGSSPSSNPNGANFNGPRRSSLPNTGSTSPVLPSRFASGNNLDVAGGFKKRDEANFSSSRPGSTTSRQTRAGAFLASARQFFSHSNTNDRQGLLSGEMSEDSHELQLHLALSAGAIYIGSENGYANLLEQYTGRLEYAICGEQMAIIDEALSMARAGELTITESAWKFLAKDSGDKSSTKDFSEKLYPKPELRRNCFILRNTQTANTSDIPRRIRNDKLLNKHVESNPHYYKYINKSAIHRLQLYPKSNFPAQFRTATILFVSLGDVKPWTAEGLGTCQKAIFQVHKVTSEYEGFIQQFAVDDKGATILCAYGLPYPRSHEREAVFAAKSAWVIRRRLLAVGIRGFKISLATGVIFTSMIGNEFRRDPAIVGDTIVIAVRMLKFQYAIEAIVCDDATKDACTSDLDGMCEFEEMADEYVKGKIHPIKVWRLIHFGAKKQNRKPTDIMVDETIGYEPERYKVEKYIENWQKEPANHAIVVSGPRGSGKSMFYQQIFHVADKNGYQVCSAASAEVEKNTEYYLCKFMLLGLFDIMKQDKIPYSAKKPESDSAINEGPQSQPQPQPQPQHQRRRSLHDVCSSQHVRQRSQPLPVNPFVLAHSNTDSTIAASTSSLSESTITDTSSIIAPTALDGPFSGGHSQFGLSVRSSVASNSPWDVMLSPTASQFGEQSKRSSNYVTKMKELISVSLKKMGEGDSAITTLHDIIAVLSCDYTAPVLGDHDEGMLEDFIVRMLNYASSYVKIILMFEDVQWCDKKSMNIIKLIHEKCPAIMVVIFSRPKRDYDYNEAHMIQSLTKLEIKLEGLKRREIEVALLKTFEDNGVKKIHPDVIDLVQEKTKGNPKFVKNMTELLKDFSHVNIVDGELLNTGLDSAKTSFKSMEEMLVKQDRTKLTRMQFDRMNAGFQRFLKIASCLGSQFSLAEVAAVVPLASMLGEEQRPGVTYLGLISKHDRFKFLSLATDQLTNVQFSSDPEQFVVMNTQYMFGSCSTAMDIYESIPYEERVAYHSRMGQFYESFREPSLMSDLLPLITRHYLRTDNTEKKIAYLREISAFDLKSNMLMDATQSLTQLIHILDTVRGAASMVSQEDLADIYGMNGECLSKRMKIEDAEPALLDSLARYGVHWPKTDQQFRVALFMEKTKFMFHYHGVSSPSLSQSRPPKAKVDSKTQLTLQRIIRVLGCLQNIYYWKTDPNSAMLSTLYSLNYSRKLGLPSSEQTISLSRYALLMYFKGNKGACNEYIEKAKESNRANEDNNSAEGTEGMLSSILGYIAYCEGDHEKGHKDLQEAINESKSFGVVSNMASFYRSVILKCAYRMWEGSFNRYPEDSALLRAMSAVAIQNGDTEGEILFAIPTLANLLLQDRIRDAESWVVLIEKFIMPKARLMNMLAIQGMLSYYYAKTGKFSKAPLYAELLAEQLPQQGIAAHPFPLMGCIFTVMALYEMIDTHGPLSSNKSYEPADTPLCSNKAEQILRPVIDWLSQDPFQAVAQTYVVLAEAFKCFITHGRNREGIQRLQRGWETLGPGLEEIRFIRAYFLAKLGRHAVSLKERDKYYSEAYELFTTMSIDWTLWLSDPLHVWSPPKVAGDNEKSFAVGAIPTPS